MNNILINAFSFFFGVKIADIILTAEGSCYKIDIPKNGTFAVNGYFEIEKVYDSTLFEKRVVLKIEKADLWYIFEN